MSSVINTNSLSLLTQNNLTKSQSSLNSAIERLSSGMRINSAKDDAAGQAIANRFTANIKGLTQASRNANDGISLAQTTEGALNEINTNLQRVRELTVQSANGSNSADDKSSIQAEITQRMDEITRLSEQTDFNGTKVLNTGVSALKIQVGANDGETISIDLTAINKTTLGLDGFTVAGTASTSSAATLANLTSAAYTTGTAGAANSVSATNFVVDGIAASGVQKYTQTITTTNTAAVPGAANTNAAATIADALSNVAPGETVVVNGAAAATAGDGNTYTKNATGSYDSDLTAGSVNKSQADMVTLLTSTTSNSTLTASGTSYTIDKSTRAVTTGVSTAVYMGNANSDSTVAGKLVTSATGTDADTPASTSSTNLSYFVTTSSGAVSSAATGGVAVYKDSAATTGNGLSTTAPVAGSATADPLKVLDAALKTVDDLRGKLGAVQNRFDSVISNLGTTVNNLKSSRSRIEDADYATEVSNMSRAQILQQAGTSVLSQANQTTQGVLSLLR